MIEWIKTLRRIERYFGIRTAVSVAAQCLVGRQTVAMRIRGLKSYVYWRRKNSDLRLVLQILGERESSPPLKTSPAVIVDAGANIGLSSLSYAARYPSAQIIAIEPEPGNCAMFRRNCASYENVRLVEAAIWSHDTYVRLEDPGNHSWAFRVIETPRDDPRSIRAISLRSLMVQFGISHIDLLKVDIEGAERQLFQPDSEWMSDVGAILVETHDRIADGCLDAVETAVRSRRNTTVPFGEYLFVEFEPLRHK